jgi:hypothetical protein
MRDNNKKSQRKNTKTWILVIALGLLIVISGVQAIELVNLKNKLNKEITALAPRSRGTISTGSSSTKLSENLRNLPSMVGGC